MAKSLKSAIQAGFSKYMGMGVEREETAGGTMGMTVGLGPVWSRGRCERVQRPQVAHQYQRKPLIVLVGEAVVSSP
jgi:hypothetical protein